MKVENNGHFRKVLEFDRFRFYPCQRLLERDGKPVELTSQLTDLLILLVTRHGELVSKETILQTLWPNSFVEENNINQAVSKLRKTLANGSHAGDFIETVPKRGFRFIAPVVEAEEETGLRRRGAACGRSVRAWIAAGIILSAIAALGYWYQLRNKAVVPKRDS